MEHDMCKIIIRLILRFSALAYICVQDPAQVPDDELLDRTANGSEGNGFGGEDTAGWCLGDEGRSESFTPLPPLHTKKRLAFSFSFLSSI